MAPIGWHCRGVNRKTATTAKPLTPAERKAHVGELVAEGKLTKRQGSLIGGAASIPEGLRGEGRKVAQAARRELQRAASTRKAA